MSILVTGATGFLGAEIVAELLRRGVACIEGWGRDMAKVEELRIRFSGPRDRLQVRRVELLDAPSVPPAIDVVIHAAALRPDGRPHSQAEFDRLNVAATQQLIDRAARAGAKRFLYVSTQSVYGVSGAPWTEDSPVHPETPYAKSKWEAETRVLDSSVASRGIARLSRLYGVTPCTRWNELPGRFVRRVFDGAPLSIHGDGTQRIDLLHVRDAARAIAELALAERLPDSFVFNVGSGRSYSLNELADVYARLAPRYGYSPVCVTYDRNCLPSGGAYFELCTAAIEEALGWQARVPLEEGIAEYFDALVAGDYGEERGGFGGEESTV